ncbi:hypothetical protein [Hyphobacterium sp.]|jgi:hypothetical protein|uniref:hypothetical protein n=1 Tax=Hyphobacterium sp. TaxID=2004662 RepID=UPI003BABD6BC
MRLLILAALTAAATAPAFSQTEDTLEFSGLDWSVSGSPMPGTYQGREALRLHRSQIALADAPSDRFMVEYDLAMESGNGFSGILFRVQENNGELVYLRHHLSGQPDALQYTPVVNGLTGWQIYASEGFWGTARFPVGDWIRVRLIVDGQQARLSLDGQPVLDIPELIGETDSGELILRGFGQTGSWIANLEISTLSDDGLPNMEAAPAPEIDGYLIDRWRVSGAFDEALVANETRLPEGLPEDRTSLAAEHHGIANLARVATLAEGADTVLAEADIQSDDDRVVILRFGYSDRVRVFLNGELLFAGSNNWRSRDYRYLGTISRDYAVPLRLRAGTNRLTLAVSENFGGWGVTGVLENSAGLNTTP